MKTKDFSGIRNSGPLPGSDVLDVPSDVEDLLEDYVDSTCSLLDELEQAALDYEAHGHLEANAADIRRIMHKLKGEASMVGVEEISQFCHEVESAFEELAQNKRTDMLLRFKDWTAEAVHSLTD